MALQSGDSLLGGREVGRGFCAGFGREGKGGLPRTEGGSGVRVGLGSVSEGLVVNLFLMAMLIEQIKHDCDALLQYKYNSVDINLVLMV